MADPAIALLQDWQPIAAMAVTISASLVALAYMIAHFLADDKLKAWSKSELLQVFYSILILALVLTLYSTLNLLLTDLSSLDPQASLVCGQGGGIPGSCPAGDEACSQRRESLFYYREPPEGSADTTFIPCHIALANNFLQVVFTSARQMNRGILGVASNYHVLSGLSFTWEMLAPPWTSETLIPLAGVSVLAESLTTSFELSVKLMALLRLQQFLLAIIHQALFPLFLVSGIILRTFFFTRKLGGLMLATAIALYTVLPGTYVVGGYIYGQWTGGTFSLLELSDENLPYPSFNPSNPDDIANTPTTITADQADFCKEPEQAKGTWERAKDWVKGKLDFIKNLVSFRFITHFREELREKPWLLGNDGILDNVAKLAIFTTIIPFIAIMSTLATIKVMSPLFGGDVDIAGLSRLI